MSPCENCKHRRPIPGNAHISCGKAFDASKNPLAAIFAILGGVGRAPMPGPTKEVDFHPTMVSWPGCGTWPANYDALIIRECAGQEVVDHGGQ